MRQSMTGLLLALLIAAWLPKIEADWLIVLVPLHIWRLWHRGYTQAALLARELARRTGTQLYLDGLVRRKATPSLGGLGKKARARTLSGAITFPHSQASKIRGANVVLVDDVLTSGATSDACVKALKKAGAKKVVIACFTRVMDEALNQSGDQPPQNATPETLQGLGRHVTKNSGSAFR
jgi:predicted amidophosphoribosyltransferase